MTALRKSAPDQADIVDRIVDAINQLTVEDLDQLDAWQPLADLSSRTQFEAIDGDPASVVIDAAGDFEAIASIYVTLVYGSSKDEESMSDEYLVTIGGKIAPEGVEVTTATVDTSPFYE